MKIAISGARGFIGMEILAALNEIEGVEAIALTRQDGFVERIPNVEWRATDWSSDHIKEAICDADCVIHLAGVRGTSSNTEEYRINESMTEALLEAMEEAHIGRIVFASTVSVYDDEKLMPWTEDAPVSGRTAYGESQIHCENLIKEHAERYGFSYAIARIAQGLGLGEKRRGMMNAFLDAARDKGTLHVMGESRVKRQYIYVKDIAKILLYLAVGRGELKADQNITVNVGMENAYSNLEIAEMINKVFDNPTPIDYDDSYPETIRGFHMDITRLKTLLDYEPLDLEDALTDIYKGLS